MAITATALDTGSVNPAGPGPVTTTTSITPAANQPVIASVAVATVSGNSPIPTLAGCGLTWTLVAQTTANVRQVFVFLGLGSSPTAGTLTITGDGSTSLGTVVWQVDQLSGVDTSVTNGVVQSVNARPSSVSSVSVPFSSTITAGNATFGAVGVAANLSPTAGTGWTAEGAASNSGRAMGLLGEFAGSGQQNITAAFSSANNAFVVGVELAAASTGGTDATASGPVAKVAVTAPVGTVSTGGGRVTVNGPVATVTVTAPAGSVAAGMLPAQAAFPTYIHPPYPYERAVRNGIGLSYIVDASYQGQPVAGATGMAPVGGQITDTNKAGVRRTLNLDLAAEPGLFDKLAPIGTTLTVTAKVTYTNRSGVLIPMGVFDVDQQSLTEGGGKLSLTAPDKWVRIQRAKFVGPTSSTLGVRVVQQIALLIQGALGASEPVTILSSSQAMTPALTWTDGDRAKAIVDLATGAGLWVYFDRNGAATIADLPTVKSSADWLIDASPSGVLVELDRQRSRTNTYNVVAVESSATSGPAFPTQYAWDKDSNSPTYAGPDPINNPGGAGPFGVVVYHYSTPLDMDQLAAMKTAASILAQTVGLASSVSLSTTPNPAIDAYDALDVLPPRERYDIQRVLERHVVDTVTHSLAADQATHIDGRSTRTDAYT